MLLFSNPQNGHSQWIVLHPSVLDSSDQVNAIACSFVNKDSGFILTKKGLAVTSNAGGTWYLDSATHVTGMSIAFPTFKDGWIESDPSHFYRTTNNGVSWELDSNTLLYPLGPDIGAFLYFQDSMKGWEGSSNISIFGTTDGGRTWQTMFSDNSYGSTTVSNVAFCNDRLGIALAGPYEMYILRTTDGGMNWQNLSISVEHSFLPDTPTGLAYTDPRHAWLSTANSGLYRSTDSGLTWTGVKLSTGDEIQSISFADSSHGLVVMRNQIINNITTSEVAYTLDGGQTWDTAMFDDIIWYATFPDTSVAYVCSNSKLYRLSTADLAVQQLPQDSTGARIESEAGNLFLVMPEKSGGQLRIMDPLGRILEDQMLPPGSRCELSNPKDEPQFRFAEVDCNGRIQIFKVFQ